MRYLLIALALLAVTEARAARLDMATETCQDWLDADDDAQDFMVAWLRGYIAGRSTSTVYDPGGGRADSLALKVYCQAHPQNGVVSGASQWGK